MAIFFAAAVWPRKSWPRAGVAALCAAFFLGATVYAGRTFFQVCDDEDGISGMAAVYRSGAGFQGYGEYAPPGADNFLVATGLPDACLVSDPSAVLGEIPDGVEADDAIPAWSAAQGSCEATLDWQVDRPEHKRLTGTFKHAGFLILRLRSYPAWRVVVNGRPIASMARRGDGLIVVPVGPGTVVLTVDWITTPDVVAGRWLSALTVLLVTGLWYLERKPSRSRL
jgi:hypothetical protein